jgi:hypothetical protein
MPDRFSDNLIAHLRTSDGVFDPSLSPLLPRYSFFVHASIIYCLSSAILFILATLACAVFQSVMLFLRLPFGSADLCGHT